MRVKTPATARVTRAPHLTSTKPPSPLPLAVRVTAPAAARVPSPATSNPNTQALGLTRAHSPSCLINCPDHPPAARLVWRPLRRRCSSSSQPAPGARPARRPRAHPRSPRFPREPLQPRPAGCQWATTSATLRTPTRLAPALPWGKEDQHCTHLHPDRHLHVPDRHLHVSAPSTLATPTTPGAPASALPRTPTPTPRLAPAYIAPRWFLTRVNTLCYVMDAGRRSAQNVTSALDTCRPTAARRRDMSPLRYPEPSPPAP